LVIPERSVHFEKAGTIWVKVIEGEQAKKRDIKTCLSDAINIEITKGLKEGEEVVEPEQKEIK